MYYRTLYERLIFWKEKKERKPLILRGARQVGKTTLVEMFSKEFNHFVSLNLELREDREIFEQSDDINEIIQFIFLNAGISKKSSNILIFIDEIQNSSNAIKLLRYFYEKANYLHVIAAGSLLESLIDNQISFPVGRVEYLVLRLLKLISLIELELDFSEEDVEFADRTELKKLLDSINAVVQKLVNSFNLGNAIKNGVPITIAGKTNVGKSTLLNALLNEEKAIVSDIAGTTRDVIEDTINLGGVTYRFIDTAGIRESTDTIENIGIERTMQKIKQASVVIYMVDANEEKADIKSEIDTLKQKHLDEEKQLILVINKIDQLQAYELNYKFSDVWIKSMGIPVILLSASENKNLDQLTNELIRTVNLDSVSESDIIVTNVRHYQALKSIEEGIERINAGLSTGISSDFIAMDIRQVLHYLGEITGEITTDEVLGNIFQHFCIGK